MQTGSFNFSCLCTGNCELCCAESEGAAPSCSAWLGRCDASASSPSIPQSILHWKCPNCISACPPGGCHVNIVHFPAWGAWEVLKEAARCGSVASLPVCAISHSSSPHRRLWCGWMFFIMKKPEKNHFIGITTEVKCLVLHFCLFFYYSWKYINIYIHIYEDGTCSREVW